MGLMTSLTYRLKRVIWPFYYRQKDLAEGRDTWTEQDFLGHFAESGVADEIARAVWGALKQEADLAGFAPRPTDDLRQVYGLADDDLDDLILAVLERSRCRVPAPSETEKMDPVLTVADFVYFVAAMKP
jgi:hypothetical protein